jgi:hypothetical protein
MSEATQLVRYEAMRQEVAACARVDEAAEIRNKADKLRAYAKQKKDHELHRWMGEIFCRATIRFGELSKALGKATPGSQPGRRGGTNVRPTGGKNKEEQIKATGISKSAAHRAEALAGARSDIDEESGLAVEALGIALDTAETYYKQCRASKTTPNQRQLTSIVEQALNDRFGKPKRPPRKRKRSDLTNAFIDFTGAIAALVRIDADLVALAAHDLCSPANDLREAGKALARLQQWVDLLEEKDVRVGSGNIGTRTIREGTQGLPAS